MRKVTLLFAVLLSLVGVTQTWADELTVYDGSGSSTYYPVQGNYADTRNSLSEFIIPAKELTEMQNASISKMTFYISNVAASKWTSTFTVYMKEIEGTTYESSSAIGDDGATVVYTGELDGTGTTMEVNFSNNYEYAGGNLLIGFKVTTATSVWKSATFSGVTQSSYTAFRNKSSNTREKFIPKTTFTYSSSPTEGASLVVKDGSTKLTSPYSYNFGLTTAGTTKTFTLSNPGSDATPISVSATNGFGAAFSDNATSIAAGGEVTLTITMPEATANGTVTVSSTADVIDDFVFNVSATVRDASKMWCNFSESLPTGWTNSGNWTISTSGADGETSGAGYAYNTSYGSNKLMYSPLVTIAEGEKLYLMIKGYGATASWNKLTIQYSADGTSWTNAKVLESITNTWQSLEVSEIPAGNWYIGFYGSYVYFTDIYGGAESTAPVLTLSSSSYDFGLVAENTTCEAITISNTGKSALTGLNVVSNNANFTVAVADDATEIAANGGTATFTVTMVPNATGAQSATITIRSDNADPLTFTVTGAVAKDGTTTALFNDATLAGWTKAGNTSFNSDETAAYFYYSTNTLASPKVTFEADDFLSVKAKMASSYGYVTVQGSVDGTTFTDIKKLDSSVLNQTDYTTAIVTGISTEFKYLRLNGYYCYVQEVGGLTYAPVLAVKDEAGSAQTSGLTYAFGEVGADQTVIYNFTNAGAGTINITNVVSDNAVFTTNWTETVVASNYDLTITANYNAENAGEQNGTVTVTTTEGEFVINLTSTFLAANAPKFAVLVGEAEQTTGADLGFGIVTANTTKEFVIKNDGTGALNVTGIALPDADYTTDLESTPSAESPLVIAAGTSKTIQLTLAASGKSIKSGKNVVISANGFDNFTFTADAYVLTGTETIDFNTAIPSTWENESNGWSLSNGAAKCTGKKNLTTSKLIFTDEDFFIFKVKASDSGSGDYVTVEGSSDNGATWTAFTKKTYSYSGDFGASTGDYSTIVVSGISSSVNKLRFNGYYVLIDEIAGLTYDDNDPRMGVYTDADCEVVAAFSLTKDFGFVTEDASVTYYIKNDGTGTMNLDLDEVPAGFSAVLGKNQLAAGESTTLTITFGQISGGYRAGDIVLNGGDAGTFTVSVSGVMIDASKLNLDFATANIPSTWTANSWTKNANGYVEAGYSSTTMETSVLSAAAGEQLVIVAKNTYASSSYTFGVKYKKTDADEWSDLIAAANQGTSWKALVATIEEAGDYLLQFTGNYAQIQHIYGLTEPSEPVMVVYDGESKAAATYSFGNVANDNDATHTFTVKNEGKAVLAGLTAALSGEQADHYSVAITGLTDGGVAAGEEATITVTQKKDNLGAHVATLTISSTSEGIADFVIALSGVTRDASKLYVDFEDGNVPEGWTNSGWTTSSKYASTGYGGGTLTTPALTVAVGETLSFDARKQYSDGTLTVRYTTDGGVNWTEQNYTNNFNNSGFSTQTLDLENESVATVIVQFVGRYVYIDNISGFAPTTAPMLALTEGGNAVANGATKAFGNLTAEGTATYTLTNEGTADMVTTVATTGVATAAISGEGEGITIAENTVTLAAGKSATITLTLPYEAPFGEKTGAMTLTSEGWVGEVTVNYTATTVDPTALYVDFANNAKPAGWYNSGFSFTSANATINSSTEATLITEKLTVAGVNDVLTYDAAKTSSYQTAALVVSYSTDRQNWIPVETQPTLSSTTASTFEVKGLEAGDYYLQFKGKYATIDNIMGWHKASPAPDHDLFFVSIDVPEGSYIPGSEYTATVKVVNLRAESETVSAELFVKNEKADELTEQVIALDETKTFTLTATVPEEGKHLAYVKVYNNAITIETEPVTFVSEHNLALEITDFALTSDAEATANAENQFTATFNVTVKNTSSRDLNAEEVRVTIVDAEGNPYQTATAAETLAVNAETTISVSVTTSALEGGVFTFKAQEDRTGTIFATAQTVSVTAAAPKFDLAVKNGAAVSDGDAVAFGLVKEATTQTYIITNSGNKALELVSIVAPAGFEATTLTDENKTIAAEGTLDIDVTLLAEQGKKSGALVFTYKVDASTNKTFTLNLSGRSVAADTWTVAFDGTQTAIPADWTNDGWQISSYTNAGSVYTYTAGKTLMTPRLAAAEGEELTFDVAGASASYPLTVEYSSNKTNWTALPTVTAAGEQTFTAPAAGNYYLRFTGRYVYLSNFVGFKANPLEHDTELAASSVPASAKQYNTYTATVTLKESAGKAEEVTATLYVGENDVTSTTQTITANGSTVITLTWEPQETISDAVNAYVAVTGTGIDLSTEPVSLTVAEVYTLDEATSASSIDAVTNETVLLKRTFIAGWNTVCLPFAISNVEAFFGEGAVAYDFTSYTDGMLNFTKVTSLTASIPYVVYVPKAIVEPMKLQNITISSYNTEGFYRTSNNAKFQGTYAPIAAGAWNASGVVYGLTKEAKIAKANIEKASINGFRAYFVLPAGAEVKALRFDGLETGVRTISADEVDGQLFDINGRKVSKTQHGIYVVNGKKVIVK